MMATETEIKSFPRPFVRIVTRHHRIFESAKAWSKYTAFDSSKEYVEMCIYYLCALTDWQVIETQTRIFYGLARGYKRDYIACKLSRYELIERIHHEWTLMWQNISNLGYSQKLLQSLHSPELEQIRAIARNSGKARSFMPGPQTEMFYKVIENYFPRCPRWLNGNFFYKAHGIEYHMFQWWEHMLECLKSSGAYSKDHLFDYFILLGYWNRYCRDLSDHGAKAISSAMEIAKRGHKLLSDPGEYFVSILGPIYRALGKYEGISEDLHVLEDEWWQSELEVRFLRAVVFMRPEAVKRSKSQIDHWYVKEELLRVWIQEGLTAAVHRLRYFMAKFPGMLQTWCYQDLQVTKADFERIQDEYLKETQARIIKNAELFKNQFDLNRIEGPQNQYCILKLGYHLVPVKDEIIQAIPPTIFLDKGDGSNWEVRMGCLLENRPGMIRFSYYKNGIRRYSNWTSVYVISKCLLRRQWRLGYWSREGDTLTIVQPDLSQSQNDILSRYVDEVEKTAVNKYIQRKMTERFGYLSKTKKPPATEFK